MSDIKERINRNLQTLEVINSWINSADNKVSISCAIFSVIYGGITLAAEHIRINAITNGEKASYIIIIVLAFSVIAMVASLAYYLAALIPKLTTFRKRVNRPSLFYGDIANSTLEKFQEFEMKLTNEQFNQEVVSEIYINSRICLGKMKKFKIGTILSGIAIVLSLVALVLLNI